MKRGVVIFFLLLVGAGLPMCSNSSSVELRKNLGGRWVEVFSCKNRSCNSGFDSLQTAEIVFDEKIFSNVLYKGGGANRVYDTSFSGKYYISRDSLELVLDRFREVFYYREADNVLHLIAAYSVDCNGVVIGDFRSVLWCCSIKKNGRFIKNQ